MVSEEPAGIVADVNAFVSFINSIRAAKSNLDSHYYYFYAGASLGGALGKGLTFADKQFDLGIITPEDPWERYNRTSA